MMNRYIETPVGKLYPSFNEEGALVRLSWNEDSQQAQPSGNALKVLADQLIPYFKGELSEFSYPMEFVEGTELQQKVWRELLSIPYGETVTYGDIASKVGSGPRPVGSAIGKNPIPILVPCHRVLAKNGDGGYSGGEGLKTKSFLLALEQNNKSKNDE